MHFLANENFPYQSILLLRQKGFKVTSVWEDYSGISDIEVIDIANKKELIILTFDKDHGEIIFKLGRENPPAVVFFRFKGETPEAAGMTLLTIIQNEAFELKKKFTVVERENIRQRNY